MNWFGNDDEPDPPAAFWPGYPQLVRVIAWHWRNPLHNFAAYVIGVKGKQFIFVASQPNTVDSSFADGGGWLFAKVICGKRVLPYISYAGRHLRFYAGWRPSGMFGLRVTKGKEA